MDSESQLIYKRMQLEGSLRDFPELSLEQHAIRLNQSLGWVRKWRQRLLAPEPKDFTRYLSRSRAPKTNPNKTPKAIEHLIIELRRKLSKQFHRPAGPKLIHYFLNRLEELKAEEVPSCRTVGRILRRHGFTTRPKRPKRQPIDLLPPNEEWEIDFGEIKLLDGRNFEFFIVSDRGTSRVIYTESRPKYNAETALQAISNLFIIHGLPKRIRLDRDTRFVASWSMDSYPSALVRFLHVLGVQPIVLPPHRPDLKPVVERAIKVLKHEWFDRFTLKDEAAAADALDKFQHYHNAERPHQGRACQNEIPDKAFSRIPPLPEVPEEVNPDAWLLKQHTRRYRRRVSASGTIQIDKHVYYVGQAYAKRRVMVHLNANNRQYSVLLDGELIATCEIKGLFGETLSYQTYLSHMCLEARSLERRQHALWRQTGDGP